MVKKVFQPKDNNNPANNPRRDPKCHKGQKKFCIKKKFCDLHHLTVWHIQDFFWDRNKKLVVRKVWRQCPSIPGYSNNHHIHQRDSNMTFILHDVIFLTWGVGGMLHASLNKKSGATLKRLKLPVPPWKTQFWPLNLKLQPRVWPDFWSLCVYEALAMALLAVSCKQICNLAICGG